MEEIKKEIEKVILIGVSTDTREDIQASLDELQELSETAGAEVVGRLVQNLPNFDKNTYIGSGKVEELYELLEETKATGIVCDDELSPAQMRHLEDLLHTKVMDRTLVILDIFASRASTSEGKIQVELAQLQYRLTRLTGQGKSMSRLGGGIGTRGPGEKKLETDRRLIHHRLAQLRRELKEVEKHREVNRTQRERNHVPVAAIVGYTNAGKSTLLNTLTDADVLEEDQLFATLDPTTRVLELPGKQEMLLTDTVGFIQKLPHQLIQAFRSTLEEAKYADYVIHVVDASNPHAEMQMHLVYETLEDLGVREKPIITLFNKVDRLEEREILKDLRAEKTMYISAKHGTGLPEFKELMAEVLREKKLYFEYVFHFEDAGKIQLIRKQGELLKEEYTADGIYVEAYVTPDLYGKLMSGY